MNILQHIIFPDSSIYSKDIGLYLNMSEKVRLVDDVLIVPAYQKVDFDTYFNYFPIKKWIDFCQIDSLYVQGGINGIALLEVIGVKKYGHTTQQALLSRVKIGKTNEWIDYRQEIPIFFSDCDVLFVRICALEEACELKPLVFGTDKPIRQQAKLMICAFGDDNAKALEDIQFMATKHELNVQIFNDSVLANLNHQTAPIIECLDVVQNLDVTHILTLCTDSYINAESIFRAVRFFEMVFLERRDIIISGHCIANDDMQAELANSLEAVLRGGSKDNVFDWSFCLFDKSIVQGFGLPLPISLRHSAQEYQYRTHKEVVPINGVAFYKTQQQGNSVIQLNYYDVRDGIICEFLSSVPDLSKIKELIWDRFWHNIHTYQYVGARLNLYALDHLIKGTYQLSQADIERFLENLYHKENRFTKYVYINPYKQEQKPLTSIKNTWMNKLKPYLGMGKKDSVVVNERSRAVFVGRKEVLVASESGIEIARIRRKKAAKLISHATKSYYEFTKNHKQIKQTLLQYRNDKKSISN